MLRKLLIALTLLSAALCGQQPDGSYLVGFTKDVTPNLYGGDAFTTLLNKADQDLCVHVYMADAQAPDGVFSCCSTVIHPNQAYVMSSQKNLWSPALILNNPTSMKIKLVASAPKTITGCRPDDVAVSDLRSGLNAWLGSELGVANAAYQPTPLKDCVVLAPGQPCRTELDVLTLFCGFTTGICRPPQPLEAPSSTSSYSVLIKLQTFFQ